MSSDHGAPSDATPAAAAPHTTDRPASDLPGLWRDPSFWGMTATQFLGAFNDNVFRQLLLLIALSATIGVVGEGEQKADLQWLALLVFAAPFLLFSSLAGYLSEIYSKRSVIVLSKVAEIAVMLLGAGAFYAYGYIGLGGLMCVLFLMGAQSAFFGPGKYGILPEILRPDDLGRANGVFLMTTFLAIIFGTVLAGLLKFWFAGSLQSAAFVCVGIAIAGTLTSLAVRWIPAANPTLKLDLEAVTAPRDVRELLWRDHSLTWAVVASSMFWLVGGIVQPSVNALGKLQLLAGREDADIWTSILAASVGLGIAIGCLGAGFFSREMVNFKMVRIGLWGIVGSLAVLSIPGAGGANLLGYWGSFACLILLGVFTGMFAVPVQVYIQSRPPEGIKGRLIATVNLANWVAILGAAVLYFFFVQLLQLFDWQRSAVFAWTALLLLPLAIFYRPRNEHV